MPAIQPIPAITFGPHAQGNDRDLSRLISPPYDVLDENAKAHLLRSSPHNIVAIDLPHLPAKSAGPDAVYQQAGRTYRQWLEQGILLCRPRPALFAYQQAYSHAGHAFRRRGLIANVTIQPFGPAPDGQGGIHPHEQTFSGPKEDRMKLMQATQAQLSPIFGLHSDEQGKVHDLLSAVIDATPPALAGTTVNDGVVHEAWPIDDPSAMQALIQAFTGTDIFIADGHHRYSTALQYRRQLLDQAGSQGLPADHRANFCLFVLVALQDPGMIVLPTHRVLGGMRDFSIQRLTQAAQGLFHVKIFAGSSLEAMEAALPTAGPHALGLYDPAGEEMAIATTVEDDPLALSHGGHSQAWRMLDVAIVQHLLVERVCQPHLCPPEQKVIWKFPHTLEELQHEAAAKDYQLGVIVQPTPLESVRHVSQAGELMPQKSTFFYPKLATGLVINPIA